MKISIIVATDKKGGIGKDNKLLWHLPADLKFFKEKTMGHHMVMGRKTFESIGKALPGRITIIITRDKTYKAAGCIVVNNIQDAIEIAKKSNETELMITGGAEIYKLAEPFANCIYKTEVHDFFEADTYFDFDNQKWIEKSRISFPPDEKNKFTYSFIEYQKK